MKFNKYLKNKIILTLLQIFLSFISYSTYANNQIIEIYSVDQIIDILKNTISFKYKVILKYKNITLHADKIIITYTQNKHSITLLQAYGNPVLLYQFSESHALLTAQALIIYYDTINNTITFTGNARIEQSGNSIQSHEIKYSIHQKTIKATSNGLRKTTIIFAIKPI